MRSQIALDLMVQQVAIADFQKTELRARIGVVTEPVARKRSTQICVQAE
jgi:hypothetical protein